MTPILHPRHTVSRSTKADRLERQAAAVEAEYDRLFFKLTYLQRAAYVDQIEKLLAEAQAMREIK